jgi:ATP-dependent DNA ligase
MSLPILSYIDSKSKKRIWKISVKNNGTSSTIITEYGIENGKMIRSEQHIHVGKNNNKSNQTTHFEQANNEAKSKWDKKINSTEYKQDNLDTDRDTVTLNLDLATLTLNPVLFPMLALEFSKNVNKVTFPVYIQPKLDGNRAIFNNKSKTFTSRTGKEWEVLKNTELYKEIQQLPFISDGELYVHDHDFKFENLGVLRKTKNLSIDDYKNLNKIKYHIYDIIDTTLTFQERNKILNEYKKNHSFLQIEFVNTYIANNQDEIDSYHSKFIKDNYEGSMIRNANSKYKLNGRSSDLLKYKDFMDAEFVITGFSGEDSHLTDDKFIIYECITNEGKKFNVQSSGTSSERSMLYKIGKTLINKKLWVKYFEMSDYNIPRFPKCMHSSYKSYIRDEVL